jgi:hypothetical protein
MSIEIIVCFGLLSIVLLGAINYFHYWLKSLERRFERYQESQHTNHRMYRDDHFELQAKHDRLVEALGMIESKPTPKQYVKKGNV